MDETKIIKESHTTKCRAGCYCSLDKPMLMANLMSRNTQSLERRMCTSSAKLAWAIITSFSFLRRYLFDADKYTRKLLGILVGNGFHLTVPEMRDSLLIMVNDFKESVQPGFMVELIRSGLCQQCLSSTSYSNTVVFPIQFLFRGLLASDLDCDPLFVYAKELTDTVRWELDRSIGVFVLVSLVLEYCCPSLKDISESWKIAVHASNREIELLTGRNFGEAPVLPERYDYTLEVNRWESIDRKIEERKRDRPGGTSRCDRCSPGWQKKHLKNMPCTVYTEKSLYFAASIDIGLAPAGDTTIHLNNSDVFDAWHNGVHYLLSETMDLRVRPDRITVNGKTPPAHSSL
jgi:hypothetical protein